MKLNKYQLVLLRIIANNPKSSPSKIDRLFYQKRIDENIPLDEIYLINWIDLKSELNNLKLIESNQITQKGLDYLEQHSED